MAISKQLLKRISEAESRLSIRACPSLIMIDYDTTKEKYIVNEKYQNDKGEGIKDLQIEVESLSDYIFSPDFEGVCIMDLFDAPIERPNLFVLRAWEIRRESGIKKGHGFSISFDEVQPSKETKASIIIKQK